jgi:hypothetical protein
MRSDEGSLKRVHCEVTDGNPTVVVVWATLLVLTLVQSAAGVQVFQRSAAQRESDIAISLENSNMEGFWICAPKSEGKKYFFVVCTMLLTTDFFFSILLQNKNTWKRGKENSILEYLEGYLEKYWEKRTWTQKDLDGEIPTLNHGCVTKRTSKNSLH